VSNSLDKALVRCKISITYFDFLLAKNPLIFGKYNDHPENPSETNKVLASFKQFGIQALRDNTSIPIILKAA
jgi:hypothetical protein